MEENIASVHGREKSLNCFICDYKFSGKESLNKHIASVHEGKKPFSCSICDNQSQEIQIFQKVELD